MVKSAFAKDNLRLISGTLSRFLSILIITVIGVAIFAGLGTTGAAMRETENIYANATNFMDLRILSSVGFNASDMRAIRNVEGIYQAEGIYTADVIYKKDGKNYSLHAMSLSELINLPVVTLGRLPEKSGECAADSLWLEDEGLEVGDMLKVYSGTSNPLSDTLNTNTFKIVGSVMSPLYISDQRGASTVGSGSTDAFIICPASDFNIEVFTEVYASVEKDDNISRFSDGYLTTLKPVKDALEKTGNERSGVRYADITKEARNEIDDARAEVADGYAELEDARAKLADARVELDDGYKEYEDGKETFEREIADAEDELADGERQYRNGLDEYNSGLAQFQQQEADANAQFALAEAELAQGQAEYDAGATALAQSVELAQNIGTLLAAGGSPEALAGLQGIAAQLGEVNPELAGLLTAYAQDPGNPELAGAVQGALGAMNEQNAAAQEQLASAKAQIDSGYAQIAQGRAELESAREQLNAAKRQLDSAKAEIDDGRRELERAREEGQQELDDAYQELLDGEAELAENLADFEKEEADALADLAQAQQDIDDAEQELEDFEMPEWYILDNETNMGFMSFKEDTGHLDVLGFVVPVFFFMVAVFVTMTTMTRLVETDRGYIGTVKSLGYARGKIAVRYLIYASVSSLAGGIIGALLGIFFLPKVIYDAYSSVYLIPDLIVNFPWGLCVLSCSLAVICSALPAFFVCLSTLKQSPASLMRPEPPKSGKRVLLEKIPFVWKNLSFTQKLSARNVFRYKKRLVMTLIGVAGCTALMFTGFSLNDAIVTIIPHQYDEIMVYDMQVGFNDNNDETAVFEEVLSSPDVQCGVNVFNKSADCIKNGSIYSATLIVPQNPKELEGFINLYDYQTLSHLELNDESVIIAQKIAKLLNIGIGDKFTLRDSDGMDITVTVGGIMKNYMNRYVFMTPALYQRLTLDEPDYNQGLYELEPDLSEEQIIDLSESLMNLDDVSGVSFTADDRDAMAKTLEALNMIVIVLVVCSGALVFVVLFSLLSINIEERMRELATVKVLGFTNREIAGYVFSESNILTVIGIVLGLFAGVALQRFILSTMESNHMMFSQDLLPFSFIISAVLTFAFALIVDLLMLPRINKIDMISSLKSIE